MTTARVQDELDVVGDLVSSLEENAERVAQGCAEAYERADSKTKVSAKGVYEFLVATRLALVALAAKAKAADEALERELGDDGPIFAKRDRHAGAMSKRLVGLRALLLANVSAEAVASAGYAGATPDDPESLAKLARKVHEWLVRENPKGAHEFASFNAKLAAKGLDDEAAALEASTKAVRKEKREEQTARNERDETLAALSAFRGNAAPMLSALYRQAGFASLADRMVAASAAKVSAAQANDEEGGKEEHGEDAKGEPDGAKKGEPAAKK